MKRMLLLGGSHAEIPMILAAKKLGYYVITTGNQPDGLGHAYADEYCLCDFSDKAAILQLAELKQVDAVCSGCNDFACLTTAYVCGKLGIGGHDPYETARILHHKDEYRRLAGEFGIVTPLSRRCYTQADVADACCSIPFPLIVKPVDLTGGKGMQRCETPEEAEQAFVRAMAATREDHVIIEEFVTGTNHGYSAYLQQQKVVFSFVDNEQYYHNPYLVSGASAPGDVPDKALVQLKADCEKLAAHLGLVDGILHIQFMQKKDGTPVIIEVCRRAPGDLYIRLVKMATGLDYPAYIVAGEAGLPMEAPAYHAPEGYYVRHCVMADAEGLIKTVAIADEIRPFIAEEFLWYHEGDRIDDRMKYKAGIVFLHFGTEAEYRQYLPKLTKLIRIRMI